MRDRKLRRGHQWNEPLSWHPPYHPCRITATLLKIEYMKTAGTPSSKEWLWFEALKRKGRQGDSPDIHWRRWRQASTSPVNTKTVTLTTFPFLWAWIQCVRLKSVLKLNFVKYPLLLTYFSITYSFFKFCTEHGSITAVQCAKFQNDWKLNPL